MQTTAQISVANFYSGRWVTAGIYARIHGFTTPGLGNWRYKDKKAGRTEAEPGFPIYRKFGKKAIRYWLPDPPLSESCTAKHSPREVPSAGARA